MRGVLSTVSQGHEGRHSFGWEMIAWVGLGAAWLRPGRLSAEQENTPNVAGALLGVPRRAATDGVGRLFGVRAVVQAAVVRVGELRVRGVERCGAQPRCVAHRCVRWRERRRRGIHKSEAAAAQRQIQAPGAKTPCAHLRVCGRYLGMSHAHSGWMMHRPISVGCCKRMALSGAHAFVARTCAANDL